MEQVFIKNRKQHELNQIAQMTLEQARARLAQVERGLTKVLARPELHDYKKACETRIAALEALQSYTTTFLNARANNTQEENKLIHCYMPISMVAGIKQYATANDRSVAWVIRKAVEEFLVNAARAMAAPPPPSPAPAAAKPAKQAKNSRKKVAKNRGKKASKT